MLLLLVVVVGDFFSISIRMLYDVLIDFFLLFAVFFFFFVCIFREIMQFNDLSNLIRIGARITLHSCLLYIDLDTVR